MKNKTTAALLAFFLGGFGVHRFYLGESGKGIIYLLFFWTFIPAFIAFIDFIIFLTMDDYKFNAVYNRGSVLTTGISTADELEKLHNLKERGIISEQEYNNRKAKLL